MCVKETPQVACVGVRGLEHLAEDSTSHAASRVSSTTIQRANSSVTARGQHWLAAATQACDDAVGDHQHTPAKGGTAPRWAFRWPALLGGVRQARRVAAASGPWFSLYTCFEAGVVGGTFLFASLNRLMRFAAACRGRGRAIGFLGDEWVCSGNTCFLHGVKPYR